MKEMDFYVKIHNKLEDEGIKVKKFDGNVIYANYEDLPIEISFEMCMCHGGRLTIRSEHCNFYYRIEHSNYEETGSNDPESELLYEIENEMIPIIKTLKTYVYSVEYWREDNPNSHQFEYFNSVERLSKFILEEDGKDIFTLTDSYIHYYPNEQMASLITYEDFKDGKLYLSRQDLVRKDVNSEWEINDGKWHTEHIICKIFKKGKNKEK
jgi:hypothetical protein